MSPTSDRQAIGLVTGEDYAILNTAREVTGILRAVGLNAAIVGGVAVFLHGHRRTTIDVDVFVNDTTKAHDALVDAGFDFDESRREFSKGDVPVHLVTVAETQMESVDVDEIENIATAVLRDLIAMKLRSGLAKTTRAQDLADVIALIRVRELDGGFAAQLPKDLRKEFRRLVKAVADDA